MVQFFLLTAMIVVGANAAEVTREQLDQWEKECENSATEALLNSCIAEKKTAYERMKAEPEPVGAERAPEAATHVSFGARP